MIERVFKWDIGKSFKSLYLNFLEDDKHSLPKEQYVFRFYELSGKGSFDVITFSGQLCKNKKLSRRNIRKKNKYEEIQIMNTRGLKGGMTL